MQKRHDQLSKRIAREIFDPLCIVDLEKEVPSLDAEHMDLWAAQDSRRGPGPTEVVGDRRPFAAGRGP